MVMSAGIVRCMLGGYEDTAVSRHAITAVYCVYIYMLVYLLDTNRSDCSNALF